MHDCQYVNAEKEVTNQLFLRPHMYVRHCGLKYHLLRDLGKRQKIDVQSYCSFGFFSPHLSRSVKEQD